MFLWGLFAAVCFLLYTFITIPASEFSGNSSFGPGYLKQYIWYNVQMFVDHTKMPLHRLHICKWKQITWLDKIKQGWLQSVEMKWNESGFRPPLCTYRLNWARRTSWGWWDDWDDTVLQTQDSKFEPWRSEAEHATSRSRRLSTILTFTRGWGRNIFCFFWTAETGNRTPNSGVKGSGTNHYPRAPAPISRSCGF